MNLLFQKILSNLRGFFLKWDIFYSDFFFDFWFWFFDSWFFWCWVCHCWGIIGAIWGATITISPFCSSRWGKKYDIICYNLCLISFDSRSIFPVSSFEISFDIHFLSLMHILLSNISKSSPSDAIMKLSIFLKHSARIFPFAVGCYRECCYLLTIWCLADFWFRSKVANKLDFIQGVAHMK